MSQPLTSTRFCATCRNLLRPIINHGSERLLMCCPTCRYYEEAQQEDRRVFVKVFSRGSNNLCESLETNLALDPTLKRCIIDCIQCEMKTTAVEVHSRSNEKMDVKCVCERCRTSQDPPRPIKLRREKTAEEEEMGRETGEGAFVGQDQRNLSDFAF
ncbi:1379_t:CDS:2 [Acaulospora morrowiae]|uniref:1379_t:CDS:1 n=1 Tax=Acaulospora morrowiae TaxID=94023 RepID=A0A9N9FXC0_9GLOM|nr:1379_t:CDS:2 [Acaulospora morrowiae]